MKKKKYLICKFCKQRMKCLVEDYPSCKVGFGVASLIWDFSLALLYSALSISVSIPSKKIIFSLGAVLMFSLTLLMKRSITQQQKTHIECQKIIKSLPNSISGSSSSTSSSSASSGGILEKIKKAVDKLSSRKRPL